MLIIYVMIFFDTNNVISDKNYAKFDNLIIDWSFNIFHWIVVYFNDSFYYLFILCIDNSNRKLFYIFSLFFSMFSENEMKKSEEKIERVRLLFF